MSIGHQFLKDNKIKKTSFSRSKEKEELSLGTVNVSELLCTLQGGGHPSTLAKAIGEVGRIAKTLYLLSYIDDPA